MQATVPEMRAYKKVYRQTKKAEREAAAVPPNRSDRWQAIFLLKKIAQSDSDYGQPRCTAGLLPGEQPIFTLHAIF